MKKKIYLYFTLWLWAVTTIAQESYLSVNQPFVAINNHFSRGLDPAGIAFISDIQWGIKADMKYTGTGIQRSELGIILPSRLGNFGAGFTFFGYKAFHQMKMDAGYARTLGEKTSVGLNVSILRYYIQDHGSAVKPSFTLSARYKISDDWRLGVSVISPVSQQSDSLKTILSPSLFTAGVSFLPSNKVCLGVNIHQDLTGYFSLRAMFSYQYHHLMASYILVDVNGPLFTVGTGIDVSRWRITVSAEYHQILGVSTQLSIVHQLSKRKSSQNTERRWEDY